MTDHPERRWSEAEPKSKGLGPEGGVRGGEIVAVGTPEAVAKEPRSYTGHYLAPLLGMKSVAA